MEGNLGRRIYLNEMLIDKISRNKSYDNGSIIDALNRYLLLKFKIEKNTVLTKELELEISDEESKIEKEITQFKNQSERYRKIEERINSYKKDIQNIIVNSSENTNADKAKVANLRSLIKTEKNLLHEESERIRQDVVGTTSLKVLEDYLKELKVTPEDIIEYRKLHEFFNGVYEFDLKTFQNCNDYLFSCFNEMYQKAKSFIKKEESKYNIIISNYMKLIDRSNYDYDDPKFVKYLRYIKRKILIASNLNYNTFLEKPSVPELDDKSGENDIAFGNLNMVYDNVRDDEKLDIEFERDNRPANIENELGLYDNKQKEDKYGQQNNNGQQGEVKVPQKADNLKQDIIKLPGFIDGNKYNRYNQPGKQLQYVQQKQDDGKLDVNFIKDDNNDKRFNEENVVNPNSENKQDLNEQNNLNEALAKALEQSQVPQKTEQNIKEETITNLNEALAKALEETQPPIPQSLSPQPLKPLQPQPQQQPSNNLNEALAKALEQSQPPIPQPSQPQQNKASEMTKTSIPPVSQLQLQYDISNSQQKHQNNQKGHNNDASPEDGCDDKELNNFKINEEIQSCTDNWKEKYKEQAVQVHPDKHYEKSENCKNKANELMKELNKAKEKCQTGGRKKIAFIEKVIRTRLHKSDKLSENYQSKPSIHMQTHNNISSKSSEKQKNKYGFFGGNIMPMYGGNKMIDENKDNKAMNDKSNTLAQKDENAQMYIDFLSEWKYDYTDSYDRVDEQIKYLNNKLGKLQEIKDELISVMKKSDNKELSNKINQFETVDTNLKLDSSISDFIAQNTKFASEIKTNNIIGKHISQYDKNSLIETSKRLSNLLQKLERRTKNIDVSADFKTITSILSDLKKKIKQYISDKEEYDEEETRFRRNEDRDRYRDREREKANLKKKKDKLENLQETIDENKTSITKKLGNMSFQTTISTNDISGPKSDIIKILDKYYKTLARKFKPTMARTVGLEADSQISDSKFNRVWNKYLDDINNDDKIVEQSQDKFFSSVKSNNLDPAIVLKPTRDDKIFFIAIIFIVRQIALAIIETCIDKGIITSLYYSLIFYLVAYTAIFIIIVIIVNIDDYKLRIIFNYFNMHINQSGMIIHLFMVIGFTMIMYLLVYYMNTHIHQVDRKTINQVEKINIIYRLQLMTISVFTFVCISLLII